MTQEEKHLLLVDLCARLPYEARVHCEWNLFQGDRISEDGELVAINIHAYSIHFKRNSGRITEIPFNRIDGTVLPYLRPMSSMTDEEKKIMRSCGFELIHYDTGSYGFANIENCIDEISFKFMEEFLNAHHFDYRGLIEKGLAFEAPERMYNIKKE